MKNYIVKKLKSFLITKCHLEYASNILPLIHVGAYYLFFALLALPALVTSAWLQAILWLLLLLLNYSLSIGIIHLHAHRKIFTSRKANRVLEFLLCFPAFTSYPTMLYMHVYLHHKYNDGVNDPTSTKGMERGLAAVGYWFKYTFVCQRITFKAIFADNAPRRWRKYRRQLLIDCLGSQMIASIFLILDPNKMLWIYAIPLILTLLNIGFFSWLTHAPAYEGQLNNSLNSVNNVMNIFVHNQGYHSLHHIAPGIHWSEIPEQFKFMLQVDERLIVPYWVTLDNAWRILWPDRFHNSIHGKKWKKRFKAKWKRGKPCRLTWMPCFGWV